VKEAAPARPGSRSALPVVPTTLTATALTVEASLLAELLATKAKAAPPPRPSARPPAAPTTGASPHRRFLDVKMPGRVVGPALRREARVALGTRKGAGGRDDWELPRIEGLDLDSVESPLLH